MWELSVLSAQGCWEPQAALRSQGYYKRHMGAPRSLAKKPLGVSRHVEGHGLCGAQGDAAGPPSARHPVPLTQPRSRPPPPPAHPRAPRAGPPLPSSVAQEPRLAPFVPFLTLPTVGRDLSGDLFHSPHFYRAPTTCWALARVLGLQTPGKPIPCLRGPQPHLGKTALSCGGTNMGEKHAPWTTVKGVLL